MEPTESPLAALKRGDRAAFDAVYEAWRPRLFVFLARLCCDRAVAEDLLQEVFLRLVTHRGDLRDDTDIGAWLFTVARNLASSQGRWRRFMRGLLTTFGGIERGQAGDAPFEKIAATERVARLERALASLSHAHREVLLLVGVEGMEPSTAARVLGIAPEAMRKRLSRARAMLAEELERAPSRPAELCAGSGRKT